MSLRWNGLSTTCSAGSASRQMIMDLRSRAARRMMRKYEATRSTSLLQPNMIVFESRPAIPCDCARSMTPSSKVRTTLTLLNTVRS